jgi:very-short-patch-repair endonuclease
MPPNENPRVSGPPIGDALESLIRTRINDWRRRLIDLSFRNRLINYRPTKSTTLRLTAPSIHTLLADPGREEPFDFHLPPEPPELDEVEEAGDGRDLEKEPPGPEDIVTDLDDPKRIGKILDNLARRSNAEFEDKALRILHLAAGFLDWHDPVRNEPLRSPLVLVPVELKRESVRHPYRLFFVEDDEIVINPALSIKLEKDAGMAVPEDWVWEDKPVAEELDEIRHAISDTDWSVDEEAVLGLFSFQKMVMYRDLLRNEDKVAGHSLVRSLASNQAEPALHEGFDSVPRAEELDRAQDPRSSYSVLDADASQRRCIEAAKRGCSFVMQGPPGTGKSQTIANVIAEALGQGKRVLFISEKAAALDVVHKRLAARGLSEFCLKLHGRDAARREVVSSLHESLTGKTHPHSVMGERDFERLAETRARLNDAAALLHRTSPVLLGKTPHQVYGELAPLHEAPAPGGAPPASEREGADARRELNDLTELIRAAAQHWRAAVDEDFVWRDFAGARFNEDERTRVLAVLEDVRTTARGLRESGEHVAVPLGLPTPASPRAARDLCRLGEVLRRAPELTEEWLRRDRLAQLKEAVSSAQTTHGSLQAAERSFAQAYPHREPSDFDADIEDRLKDAIRGLDAAIGRSDVWEEPLVGQLPHVAAFAAQAKEQFDALDQQGRRLAELLGQPWLSPTLEQIERLKALADLAFHAADRPDQRWLVPAGLERARATLEECRPVLSDYREALAAVRENYSDEVLQLDITGMLSRFEASQGRRFAKLSGTYRADAKALKATRKDGRVPKALVEELLGIQRLLQLGQQIDERAERDEAAFGAWSRGRETDPEAINRACQIAEQGLELMAPDTALDVLATRLCLGSQAGTDLAQSAALVESSLTEVRSGLDLLGALSGRHRPTPLPEQPVAQIRAELERLRGPTDALARLLERLRDGRRNSSGLLSQIEQDAHLISTIYAERSRIDSSEAEWAGVLGGAYQGGGSDWGRLSVVAFWLEEFFGALQGEATAQIKSKLLAAVRGPWPDFESLTGAVNQYEAAAGRLARLFDSPRAEELGAMAAAQSAEEMLALVNPLTARVDDLHQWTDFRAAQERMDAAHWDVFLGNLREQRVPAGELEPTFRRAYWNRRLDRLFEEHPELREFRGRSHEQLIDEFRRLDRQLVAAATDRIIAVCNQQRPAPVAVAGSEVWILKREAGKKRRHMPVRKLLEGLPTLLPALKPCLMMSPLSVSHYLSPDHRFDLVIFDEASQVPPWDAINCIYRGDQLVVAGDSKQLPPTPFFQLADPEGEEYDEEEDLAEEVMESILDSCEALFPSESLRWHYRSRHEHLISFSNHHIYGNKLVTFPAPVLQSDKLGVHLIHVPAGVYDRARSRANRVEARSVAERVIEHLQLDPDRSLGVVAFSVAHADAIQDELELIRAQHPELESHFIQDRLDGIFVKNLESVQGDERDVMIFSVGYGYDQHGKFHMAFGPLNKDGGHRRLNVAVTRAREQVDVVTSVLCKDFSLAETAAPGARLLRDYLDFAEQGPAALRSEIEAMGGEYESPFEESVADAVRDLGYQVIPQVGVGGFRIDLGVVNPTALGRFALGIECDGATYHSTPTARDRDRLRQEILEDLGWRIHRIWSWDWVRDRRAEMDRLQEAIKASLANDGGSRSNPGIHRAGPSEQPTRERERLTVHEIRDSEDAAELPWVQLYERANLTAYSSYEFHDPGNLECLVRALTQLLEVEAPVERDYAIKRLAESQDIFRRGSRVVEAGRKAIQRAVSRNIAERRGSFLWLPAQELEFVRTPDPYQPETRREIEQIPPEEIDLALAKLREASGAQDDEQLVIQVARVLGFDRTGARIQKVLKQRLRSLRDTEPSARVHGSGET